MQYRAEQRIVDLNMPIVIDEAPALDQSTVGAAVAAAIGSGFLSIVISGMMDHARPLPPKEWQMQ
jgi:hypothetical protein